MNCGVIIKKMNSYSQSSILTFLNSNIVDSMDFIRAS